MGMFNELAELEKQPQTNPEKRPQPPVSTEVPSDGERPNARTVEATPDRPTERPFTRSPERRITLRRSFELYADQYEALKNISIRELQDGGLGSMSKMVRDAIDEWIAKRQFGKDADEANARTVERPTDRRYDGTTDAPDS